MTDEHTSERLGTLASRALRDPASLTLNEIRSLAASVLTQVRDREAAQQIEKPRKRFRWPFGKKKADTAG